MKNKKKVGWRSPARCGALTGVGIDANGHDRLREAQTQREHPPGPSPLTLSAGDAGFPDNIILAS